MDAYCDDRGQTLSDVFAREVLFETLEEILTLGICVDGTRQRGAESRKMGAAVPVEDGVGEGQDIFVVAVVPLEGHLELVTIVSGNGQIYRILMEWRFRPVQIAGELRQTSVEMKHFFAVGALVQETNLDTGVQKRQLAEMSDEEIGVKLEDRKDFGVRFEADDRPGAARRTDRFEHL